MDLSPFWFGLYKLAKYAVYPYTWLVLLLGLLTISVLRRPSPIRILWIRLLTISTLLLMYTLGNPLVARLLAASLEEQYAPFDLSIPRRFDAIVVLGGGIFPKGTLRPTDMLSHFSAQRTLCGADLFLRGYAGKMLLAGGDGSVFGEGPQEALEMKRLAVRLGVPESIILVETRSRTTYEGAIEIGQVLGGQSILLVTSANHMPRALALFRKHGLDVTPYPCGYFVRHRSDNPNMTVFDFFPRVDSLQISTYAISEIVGMWVYRAAGKL
jgi:uncharacterized SAM-binding protein YcdF (DUF218 family)